MSDVRSLTDALEQFLAGVRARQVALSEALQVQAVMQRLTEAIHDAYEREITVLDLSVLTPDGLSAEGEATCAAVLEKFRAEVDDVLRRCACLRCQWSGSALLALFDAPEQAVNAAQEIQELLPLFNRRNPLPRRERTPCRSALTVQAGVHAGALLFDDRQTTGQLSGQTIARVKQIQSVCPAGAVAVSEAAHRRLAERDGFVEAASGSLADSARVFLWKPFGFGEGAPVIAAPVVGNGLRAVPAPTLIAESPSAPVVKVTVVPQPAAPSAVGNGLCAVPFVPVPCVSTRDKPWTCVREVPAEQGTVYGLTFHPNGKELASAGENKTIKIWNVESGALLRTLEGHGDAVRSVHYRPDGKGLASGSWDNTVKLWEADSGKLLRTLSGHNNYVVSVRYRPDGKELASASTDRTVKVWDLESEQARLTLTGHGQFVVSVSYRPDGKELASGSYDNTVRLWDSASGESQRTLRGHQQPVTSLCYRPDGKELASGSRDGTIALWDVEAGKAQRTLQSPDNTLFCLAYRPDGRELVCVGEKSNKVILWDIESPEPLQMLDKHTGFLFAVCFSPDGKLLASAGKDGTIRLWQQED